MPHQHPDTSTSCLISSLHHQQHASLAAYHVRTGKFYSAAAVPDTLTSGAHLRGSVMSGQRQEPSLPLQALSTAMTVHHEVLRAQLNKYKGVEMQSDGDAVLLGFRDPVSAIAWCLATQQVPIAAGVLSPWVFGMQAPSAPVVNAPYHADVLLFVHATCCYMLLFVHAQAKALK